MPKTYIRDGIASRHPHRFPRQYRGTATIGASTPIGGVVELPDGSRHEVRDAASVRVVEKVRDRYGRERTIIHASCDNCSAKDRGYCNQVACRWPERSDHCNVALVPISSMSN